MPSGCKHLVSCICVLPQLKARQNPPTHRFVVFSVINDDDSVVVKYAQCNNCGRIHRVIGVCQSKIQEGKEHMSSIRTVDEVKAGLPEKLVGILETAHADFASFEAAEFIIENGTWGDRVVLSVDEESGESHGKYVRILSSTLFKVDNVTSDAYVTEEKKE